MRVAGHPLHVVLVHFPVALWPAHFVFHAAAGRLPAGVAGVAGFWLLAAATILGWAAAVCGAMDWIALLRAGESRKIADANIHGMLNGIVLLAFTAIAAHEFSHYPLIVHGPAFLVGEAAALALLFLGNFFGGAIIWRAAAPDSAGMK